MTNADRNVSLSEFVFEFIYNITDKFNNDLYVFKVSNSECLKKLKKFLKKQEGLLTNFTYTKDDEQYIKIKKQHIKQFNKIKFIKNNTYKTDLNLVYFDYMEKQGYYGSLYNTTDANTEVFSDDSSTIHQI